MQPMHSPQEQQHRLCRSDRLEPPLALLDSSIYYEACHTSQVVSFQSLLAVDREGGGRGRAGCRFAFALGVLDMSIVLATKNRQ